MSFSRSETMLFGSGGMAVEGIGGMVCALATLARLAARTSAPAADRIFIAGPFSNEGDGRTIVCHGGLVRLHAAVKLVRRQ